MPKFKFRFPVEYTLEVEAETEGEARVQAHSTSLNGWERTSGPLELISVDVPEDGLVYKVFEQ